KRRCSYSNFSKPVGRLALGGREQDAGVEQFTDARQQFPAQLALLDLQQVSECRTDGANAQFTVAGTDQRGERGTSLDRARETAALAERDDGRMLVARPVVALLGHVTRDHERAEPERLVAERRLPVMGGETGHHVLTEARAIGAHGLVKPFESAEGRGVIRPPAQREIPEADTLDAARIEVVEPRGVERIELGRTRPRAAVTDPGLRIARGILRLALDDPGVEACSRGAANPARDTIETVLTVSVLPVAEQLGDATRHEARRRTTDDLCDEGVADHAAVSVLVLGHPTASWGDHEWRVGDDLVEELALNRFEQVALAELDGADLVELGIEAGERDGARGDVRGHDSCGVPRGVHRLNTAARAEVEHRVDRLGDHEAAEGHGRAADPQHMVGPQSGAARELPEIARDPPVPGAAAIGEAVRSQVDERTHEFAALC